MFSEELEKEKGVRKAVDQILASYKEIARGAATRTTLSMPLGQHMTKLDTERRWCMRQEEMHTTPRQLRCAGKRKAETQHFTYFGIGSH